MADYRFQSPSPSQNVSPRRLRPPPFCSEASAHSSHSHIDHTHVNGPHTSFAVNELSDSQNTLTASNARRFPPANVNNEEASYTSPALLAQSPPAIPMGPPPSFEGKPLPHFATPARFVSSSAPVFTRTSAVRGNTNFSEIPLAPGTPPPARVSPIDIAEDDHTTYSGLADDQCDAFVLFSSQTVLKEKKITNTASLGFGALVCPGRETVPGPPMVRRDALRCQSCGAYANLHCSIVPSSSHWQCIFCHKLNSSNGEYGAGSGVDSHNWPELVTSVVDYVDAGMRHPGFVSVSDSTMTAPVVVLIDDTLDEIHLRDLQSSLHSFLDSLSPAARIGIVTYGQTISVYDLSEPGVAAADVLPGEAPLSQELLKMLIYGTGVYLAPIHVCLPIAQSIVSALRPYRGSLPEVARDRCLGMGIEVALGLIEGPSTELPRSTVKRSGGSSRVLVCAGGPMCLGPGSLPQTDIHPNHAYLENRATKHMEHLGQEARRLDVAVDVICAGTCPVRISTLQPLTKASGGVLVLHDDFGEVFGLNMQRAVQRATGFCGVLEVRCSKGIAVTHVIGPGEEVHGDRESEQLFKTDTSTAVQMLSVEDCQAFTLVMKLQESLTDDYAYFQFAAHFTSLHQVRVTRVMTVRLPTTSSVSTYLQSVDDEVEAVLLAKKTVLEAKSVRDAVDARVSIDERLKDIAVKFGKAVAHSKLRSFPTEMSRLPELLFHLRRGPLLGSIVGHEDERAMYRSLYLQAGFDLSLRMLAPRLLMHQEAGTFEELPAHDLAMQSDAVIVLDHGTDIFIWTGLDVAADEAQSAAAQAACRTLAHELTEHRFPAPRMLAFKEASSQARYLQARLIPAHKDSPYEQEVRFPQLRTLKLEQRARLKGNFLQTDDFSFCEWMRSLKLVPPEPC